ncbi:unnamed protein product, partial [Pylaiella littoralis]
SSSSSGSRNGSRRKRLGVSTTDEGRGGGERTPERDIRTKKKRTLKYLSHHGDRLWVIVFNKGGV